MSLGFVEDAICLSGLTGSRLKCKVIGQYYPFWWKITSGGPRANHNYDTAIVELDAATGEVYIEDTSEMVLGSSGHAMDLRCTNPDTKNLKVILVEQNAECYAHLKNVIRRRWSNVDLNMAEGPVQRNSSGLYLLNEDLDTALNAIQNMRLGNALFFFDPLRSVEHRMIRKVAQKRILNYYETGTEFIVFIFTSDWFLGRDDFAALPATTEEATWSPSERKTVLEADALLGNTNWRSQILTSSPIHEREHRLIELYRRKLHEWFRYVLPMPFNPKRNQVFHLIICSNYEAGIRATRDFYCDTMHNTKYSPDNPAAFRLFRKHHPDLFLGLSGNRRPLHWRTLWKTITDHEEGICDCMCSDYSDIGSDAVVRQRILGWLETADYLMRIDLNNAWNSSTAQYRLNWVTIKDRLGVDPPPPLNPLSLKPLSLEELGK